MAPSRNHTTSAGVDGFDNAYRRLVDARNEYDMLKSSGASSRALARAHGSLHQARADTALRRMSI
jgi:hypothetical protein